MSLCGRLRRREELASRQALTAATIQHRLDTLELCKIRTKQEWSEPGAAFPMALESQEERYLLVGCTRGSLHCLDLQPLEDGREAATIVGARGRGGSCHYSFLTSLAWLPTDSGLFATGATDYCVRLWDANRFKVVESHSMGGEVAQVAWSLDGRLLGVAAGSNYIILVDVRTGAAVKQMRGVAHSAPATCLAWSPRDAPLLVSGGGDGEIVLWDIRGGASLRNLRAAKMRPAKASPATPASPDLQSRILVAQRLARKVPRPRRSAAHAALVSGLRWAPDGLRLYSVAHDARLKVWEGPELDESGVHSLARPGYDSVIANKLCHFDLASHGGMADRVYVPCGDEIVVLEMGGACRRWSLEGHYAAVNAVVYAGSRQQLFSSSADRQLLRWRARGPAQAEEAANAPANLHKLTQDSWSDED